MSERVQPSYWDYLRLDQLLALQGGLEGDDQALVPDELHFVVVHQVFELWFKLVLRELRLARDHLAEPRVPEERIPYVVHHLSRVNRIMRLGVDQFEIMETLTPQDFLAFRDKLVPASGFQSFQMRELELLLGMTARDRASEGGLQPLRVFEQEAARSPGARKAWERVQAAAAETTLKAALAGWLHRTPIDGSTPDDPGDAAAVDAFLEGYLRALERRHVEQRARFSGIPGADPQSTSALLDHDRATWREFLFAEDVPATERARVRRVRAGIVFVESYRQLPLLAWPRLLLDAVVELEENLVLWRTRHARMVERVIGRRIGTGGSSGVDYLDATARVRIFGDLWTARTILLPREALPPLQRGEAYGFRS
jgi:tryptophan 2,3-dioxygenase